MKKNFNKSGRFIRGFMGLALLAASLTDLSEDIVLDNVMLGIGIYLVISAAINFCMIYYFLGIDTAKSKDKMKMY